MTLVALTTHGDPNLYPESWALSFEYDSRQPDTHPSNSSPGEDRRR